MRRISPAYTRRDEKAGNGKVTVDMATLVVGAPGTSRARKPAPGPTGCCLPSRIKPTNWRSGAVAQLVGWGSSEIGDEQRNRGQTTFFQRKGADFDSFRQP